MKGLILKDLYVISKQMGYILVMVVLFTILLGYSFGAFAVILCAMLPITTIGFDERAKWDKYAATMPYSRTDIVLSKYLFGLGCMLFAVVIVLIGNLGNAIFTDTAFTAESIIYLVSIFCIALVFLSVNRPFMFKWGVEKGRMIFIIGIAVFAAVIAATSVMENSANSIETFLNDYFYLFILGAIAILGASIPLSISFYKKREL
jgi:ABC-2 type transport system permease protein